MIGWKKTNTKGESTYSLDVLQRLALAGMFILTILTFVGANLQAYLWQSSHWLVSTVLPSVVVSLTNEEREDLNQAPLRRSAALDRAAKLKAEHMARNEYFSHYAPDGTSPWYWFDQAGYVYAHAGENLAIHFSDSDEVVEAWMNSPTHRANIVNTQFTEIGVGTAKGEYDGFDTVYVVQLFGTPAKPVAVAPRPTPAPAPVLAEAVVEEPEPIIPVSSRVQTLPPTETTPPVPASTESEDTDVLAATDPVVVPTVPEVVTEDVATTTLTEVATASETIEADISTSTVPTTTVEPPILTESTIATSSGLEALIEEATTTEMAPFAGVATRPNSLLQIVYTLFGFVVIGLLVGAAVLEVRKDRYVQVAYSLALLGVMGGLWYIHTLLTTGAVVI